VRRWNGSSWQDVWTTRRMQERKRTGDKTIVSMNGTSGLTINVNNSTTGGIVGSYWAFNPHIIMPGKNAYITFSFVGNNGGDRINKWATFCIGAFDANWNFLSGLGPNISDYSNQRWNWNNINMGHVYTGFAVFLDLKSGARNTPIFTIHELTLDGTPLPLIPL